MNLIDREHILTRAAEQYMRGEISYDEMTAIRLEVVNEVRGLQRADHGDECRDRGPDQRSPAL